MSTTPDRPTRAITATSYAAFALIGWSMLMVPSLIREIRDDFGQTDAGFGVLYLLASLLFGTGAVLSGALAGRVGRRAILPVAAIALAAGLATQGLAPAWPVLLLGAALAGGGSGALDAGVNSVIMDLSVAGRGDALSRLHLFYSIGALTAPLVLGQVVGAGVDWRVPMVLSSVAALVLVAPLRLVGSVPPRARVAPAADPATAEPMRDAAPDGATEHLAGSTGVPRGMLVPLAALAFATACYVASEAGVSSWLVAFLEREPLATATLALSLFWLGIALGRLTAGRLGRSIPAVRYAVASAFLGGAAIAAAVLGPSGAAQILLFGIAGFGLGPVYPMIMAVAGSYYPHRAAAVSGLLTTAGVVGSVTYPPLMGFTSASVGLAAGMLGAAVLAFVCGLAVIVAASTARRRMAVEPVRVADPGRGAA